MKLGKNSMSIKFPLVTAASSSVASTSATDDDEMWVVGPPEAETCGDVIDRMQAALNSRPRSNQPQEMAAFAGHVWRLGLTLKTSAGTKATLRDSGGDGGADWRWEVALIPPNVCERWMRCPAE